MNKIDQKKELPSVILEIAEKERLSKIKQTEISDSVYNDLQKLKPIVLKIAELAENNAYCCDKDAKEKAKKILNFIESTTDYNVLLNYFDCSCLIDNNDDKCSREYWSIYLECINDNLRKLVIEWFPIYGIDPCEEECGYYSNICFYENEIVEKFDKDPIELFIKSFYKRIEDENIQDIDIECDLDI